MVVFLFPGVWTPTPFYPSGAAAHSFYDHAMELTLTNEIGLTDVPAEAGGGGENMDVSRGH